MTHYTTTACILLAATAAAAALFIRRARFTAGVRTGREPLRSRSPVPIRRRTTATGDVMS